MPDTELRVSWGDQGPPTPQDFEKITNNIYIYIAIQNF